MPSNPLKRHDEPIKSNFFQEADNELIPDGKTYFCPAGNIEAFKNLTVEGYFRVEGAVTIKENLNVPDDGVVDLETRINIGWDDEITR